MQLEKYENELRNSKDKWRYTLLRPEWLQVLSGRLRDLFLPFCLLSSAGCSTISRVLTPPSVRDQVTTIASDVSRASGDLTMLSWIGGLSTLFGIVAFVLTRGTMGIRAILIGIGLVILNFIIANYLTWFVIPVLVVTGAITALWCYKTIREYLEYRNWTWY